MGWGPVSTDNLIEIVNLAYIAVKQEVWWSETSIAK